MQSPVDYAIEQLFFRIPNQILALAFIGPYALNNPFVTNTASLPQSIRDQVVYRRVLQDFNLLGGVEDNVPLYGLEPQIVDQYTRVYHIPKERTKGRTIIDVLSMSFGNQGTFGFNQGLGLNQYNNNGEHGRGALTDGLMNIVSSYSAIPQVSTANIRLIGENTVMITDVTPIALDPWLRCRLSYNPDLGGVTPNFWPFFAELVFLATKAWIYNQMIVRMDLAQLIGGQELGTIREIIQEYADADRTYVELRDEKLGKKSFLADKTRKHRHLRMVMGGSN